jgi:hypothetical protein
MQITCSRLALVCLAVLALTDLLACSAASPLFQIQPASADVAPGGAMKFAALLGGSQETSVVWSVREPDGGTIDADGNYTAPDVEGTYHVIASVQGEPSPNVQRAEVHVRKQPDAGVTISPKAAALSAGQSITFSASVTGESNASVTWSVEEGGAGGTVTAVGVYTAPQTAGTYHIVAQSSVDPAQSDRATVTVTEPAPPSTPPAPPSPPPPTPTDSSWVDVTSFGAVGDGVTDDTAAFTTAAATQKNLRIAKPPVHYKLTGRVRVYGSVVGDGSMPEIRMYGADGQETHTIFEVRDYTGTGLVFSGLHLDGQWDQVSADGEWSHLIAIKGSKNVTIENNLLERPYGDCILLGGEGDPSPSENIVIQDNQMDQPRRCDVALISAKNVSIEQNVIRKENGYVSAIDLEPNPNGIDFDQDVSISNNEFHVLGAAIMLYRPPGNPPSGGVTISGNTGDAGVFFYVPPSSGSWGQVTLSNNAF